MRRRGEKRPIPAELKDEKYFERRRRNNQAAKKSRDARRIREDQSEDYKNRLKSERAWDIIARNVNKTKKDVKTRWRHLRDVFLKELKKVRKPRSGDPGSPNEQYYSGKWTYYQHMLFLKDVSMRRPTEGNSVHQETGNNDYDASLPSTSRSEQNLQLPDEENSTAMSNRSEAFVSSDDEPLSTSARSTITQSTSALSTEALDSGLQTGSQKRNIAWRACFLEQENASLRAHVAALRQEALTLRTLLAGSAPDAAHQSHDAHITHHVAPSSTTAD
ncbi:unnamed protein product [Parnassius apollo]|uniref:(apollo) hypothetical protein n=1 Tax=Parnassius apollo TaxID=110799 RepID=A0A8S3XBB8_PARAO|nr:unnamed protein product [Parnassius apollo]